MNNSVEYRGVVGYPAYRVGSDGSIWTRWRKGPGSDLSGEWKRMEPTADREHYRRVDLHSVGGSVVTRKVAPLVCEAFHGPRPPGMVCRHDNDVPGDDRSENLLWGTIQQNTDDRRRNGNIPCGMRHGKTKLTQEQIDSLLALNGTMSQQEAANQFGVSRGYVGQLWSGRRQRVPIQRSKD